MNDLDLCLEESLSIRYVASKAVYQI